MGDSIEEVVIRLKNKLRNWKMEDILTIIALDFKGSISDYYSLGDSMDFVEKTGLNAPYRQYKYLIGLLMSVEESPTANYQTNLINEVEELKKDIIVITNIYDDIIKSVNEKSLRNIET